MAIDLQSFHGTQKLETAYGNDSKLDRRCHTFRLLLNLIVKKGSAMQLSLGKRATGFLIGKIGSILRQCLGRIIPVTMN
jgi:hypothetical protein